MCGITGVISFNGGYIPERDVLERMAAPLRFRGPDQEGYLQMGVNDIHLSLAHKRLSIIDLSEAGRQPMYSNSGSTVIVFNGEIYNYTALKKELQQLGHIFRSGSDTEVILNGYEAWGIEKTLDRLDGMFAFALYDIRHNRFILARDRFGKKPLYYHSGNDFLAFSSDIRSFYALPISLSIDLHALGYYYAELSTPVGNSIWEQVAKLPPASYLQLEQGKQCIQPYWYPDYTRKSKDSLEDAIARCSTLLEEAVARRLVADVPVGTFLSGGIDSSLVTMLAARQYGRKLSTFSVGFDYERYNELPYARQVAAQAQTDHHEISVNPLDADVFDSLIGEFGEPFADSSMIPTYFVSRFAAQHVKVVLGGDGGDEIFGGYRTYNQGMRMQQWYRHRKWLRPVVAMAGLSGHPKAAYLQGIFNYDPATIASALYRNMGFSPGELKALSADPAFSGSDVKEHTARIEEAMKATDNIFDCLLLGSIKTRLVNDYFVKVDRASMFASLEVRTPFVDRALAEYTASLPPGMLLHNGINKYITKKIAAKYFSDDFIHRPKMGFGIPVGEWIRKELKDYFHQYIIGSRQHLFELDEQYVRKIYDDHMSGIAENKDKLWTVFVLNRWAAGLSATN